MVIDGNFCSRRVPRLYRCMFTVVMRCHVTLRHGVVLLWAPTSLEHWLRPLITWLTVVHSAFHSLLKVLHLSSVSSFNVKTFNFKPFFLTWPDLIASRSPVLSDHVPSVLPVYVQFLDGRGSLWCQSTRHNPLSYLWRLFIAKFHNFTHHYKIRRE